MQAKFFFFFHFSPNLQTSFSNLGLDYKDASILNYNIPELVKNGRIKSNIENLELNIRLEIEKRYFDPTITISNFLSTFKQLEDVTLKFYEGTIHDSDDDFKKYPPGAELPAFEALQGLSSSYSTLQSLSILASSDQMMQRSDSQALARVSPAINSLRPFTSLKNLRTDGTLVFQCIMAGSPSTPILPPALETMESACNWEVSKV